jgi:sugar phosphate isomerase/epimerase
MAASKYSADAVGICPGTLLADRATRDAAAIEVVTRAAAGAGFQSMAVWSFWVNRYGVEETRALVDDAGLTVRAVEAVLEWGNGPDAARKEVQMHLDIASALGANVLQAAILSPTLETLPHAVEGFAALCERARAHDVNVSIEFVPWMAIPDLETAWRVVRESGAPNGGICVDMMHWQRQPGGPNFELLREIPGDRIFYAQVCDAGPTPTESADAYLAEALSARPLPGEGVVDIGALLEVLGDIGADPYFAFETFNTEVARAGPDVMAAKLRDTLSPWFA